MLGIYYNNVWGAKSLPFMSTSLRSDDGSSYPVSEVFTGGVLNQTALEEYGLPKLTGTFAYSMLMANAAVSRPFSLFYSRSQANDAGLDRRVDRSLLYLLGW